MKQRFLLGSIFGCLVLGLATVGLLGQAPQPEVSLDDHPNGPPLMGPTVGPPMWPNYMSAEDEFGLWLPASLAGFVGPSPSLLTAPPAGPFFDSDVLIPGPVLFMRFAPAPTLPPVMPPLSSPYYMDGISCDHSQMQPCPNGLFVRFSVDRATGGLTPGDASYQQAMNNEQPADIYRSDRPYQHVGWFVPLPAPVGPPWYYGGPLPTAGTGAAAGAVNQLMFDHWGTFGFLPAPPCPTITPGSHDNIDAFNEWPVSLQATNIFFALHPADAIPRGNSPADIFICPNPPGGLVWGAAVYATAASVGLDTYGAGTDSIDGLAFFDNGVIGLLEPGIDYVAFTLAPGSATLRNTLATYGIVLTAADVFVSDFNGYFCTWLIAADLGVGNNPNVMSVPPGPLPVIGPTEINIDALDLTIDPEPVPYINPITKPITNPGTKR